MNKKSLIEAGVAALKAKLAVMEQAARGAREAAIHVESKAEDQYDTRGLEASYLAGAQSKRAYEIQETIDAYRALRPVDYNPADPVGETALVQLEGKGGASWYFLVPVGSGLTVEYQSKRVHFLAVESPLGEAVLGKKVGDDVDFEGPEGTREYEVLAIL